MRPCEEILREDLGSTSRCTTVWKCWDAPAAERVACCVLFFLSFHDRHVVLHLQPVTDGDSRCWAAGPDVAYPSRLAQQLSAGQNIAGIKVLRPQYRKLSERLFFAVFILTLCLDGRVAASYPRIDGKLGNPDKWNHFICKPRLRRFTSRIEMDQLCDKLKHVG